MASLPGSTLFYLCAFITELETVIGWNGPVIAALGAQKGAKPAEVLD